MMLELRPILSHSSHFLLQAAERFELPAMEEYEI